MPDNVQRTLIMTQGQLAQAAGEILTARLTERGGPQAAVAVVAVEAEAGEGLETAVTTALTRISPPDLAAVLMAQGWRLGNVAEMSLILLMDAMPGSSETAVHLTEQVTSLIYRHLGIETASLFIWLVGEAGEEATAECLTAPIVVTRGTAVLGLRNEAGLRLPDDAALSQMSAELLWCLVATPLRDLPEQAALQNSQVVAGQNSLFTLGVFGWTWSPAATHVAFTRRWMEGVLAHWLASAADTPASADVSAWLKSQHLSLDDFATSLLKEEEKKLPLFPQAAWRMPWPWEIPRLLTNTLFVADVDEENLPVIRQYACLRLAEPLQRAVAVLQKKAQTMLNENPVAGIAHTCAWLQAIIGECDRLVEQTLDQEEVLAEGMSMLVTTRGPVEAKLKSGLAAWPPSRWQSWLAVSLRPWRWPELAWRYSQLQQAGQQLSYLLKQQASLKRQEIVNKSLRQAMSELAQAARRVHGQVEEIADMLQYLAGESATTIKVDNVVDCQCPVLFLPMPHNLYSQLVPDEIGEAVTAAAGLGGLGQQVTRLDDAIGTALLRLGGQRLAGVWELTAVDALLAWTNEQTQMQVRWSEACEAARPLWRVDEAQLNEMTRTQNGRVTAVCGANIRTLANALTETDGSPIWLESSDRERLWIVRARVGLG